MSTKRRTYTEYGFALGFTAAFVLMALVQDWFGQKGWVEFISNNWTYMHWAWWLIPAAIIVYVYRLTKTNEMKARGMIKGDEQ